MLNGGGEVGKIKRIMRFLVTVIQKGRLRLIQMRMKKIKTTK